MLENYHNYCIAKKFKSVFPGHILSIINNLSQSSMKVDSKYNETLNRKIMAPMLVYSKYYGISKK